MAELDIIPECYIDTNLLETILPTAKGYNHQKGCNNVVKVMKEKLKEKFAVGIVDKDKRQIRYVDEFEEIGHTESLFFYKHPEKPHFIIMISPAMDNFILKCASEEKVSMEQSGFSSELKAFTAQTKQVSSKEELAFKRLFQEIKGAEEIKILKAVLKYLKDNKYNSKIEALKILIDK